MYPHERSLVETYADRPFSIVGINSDPRDTLRKVEGDGTVLWRNFWDGGTTGGPIATRWNVQAWPTVYIIDHEGVIRFKGRDQAEIDAALEEWVAAAEAAAQH